MADFTEITITEDEQDYTCPVFIKNTSMNCFGKILEHDGENGKMLIVNQTEGLEAIYIYLYPNSIFPSVSLSDSSDETEFDTAYDDTQTILEAY